VKSLFHAPRLMNHQHGSQSALQFSCMRNDGHISPPAVADQSDDATSESTQSQIEAIVECLEAGMYSRLCSLCPSLAYIS